jgi:hypothetical protein
METKNLPRLENSVTFEIDMTNKAGEKFQGKFVVHRPTVKETIKIGLITAKELEGQVANVDVFTYDLAQMVATFDVVVDEAPKWFDPREMRDSEVLRAVWQKYADHLRAFQGESPKASE